MENRLKQKLSREFYLRDDVVSIAKELIGKVLCTFKDGHLTAGIIIETEAYAGEEDKASHAWMGRRTTRNKVMYEEGGTAYVYLCYGIHNLFNVVTHDAEVPHAVLIRGIQPIWGIDEMVLRRNKPRSQKGFGIGPGKVTQALGIQLADNGLDLLGERIWISDIGLVIGTKLIKQSSRIGVSYAGADAKLPYRFHVDIEKTGRINI